MRPRLSLVMMIGPSCLVGWACNATTTPPAGSGGMTIDDGASGGKTAGGSDGSASGGSDPAEAGGATGSGGSSNSGGTSSGGGNESSGGSASAALETVTGALDRSVVYSQPIFSGGGRFLEQLGTLPWGCEWRFAGDCRYAESCSSFPYESSPDAGAISLTSPDVEGTLTITWSNGAYNADLGQFSPTLGGGEALVLSAAGGADLPAFDVDATFPLLILVDAPSGDLSAPISVPTGEDLSVSFRRATAGVYLYAYASNPGEEGEAEIRRLFQCAAGGDPGNLIIPQVVLEGVDPGTTISFSTMAITPFEAGGSTYSFNVVTDVTDDAREGYFELVTE